MKRLTIIVAIIGAVILAGYLFVRFSLQTKEVAADPPSHPSHKKSKLSLDLRPLFLAKLKQMVNDGSDGLYHLDVDSMVVDVLNSRVELIKPVLTYDSLVWANKEKENSAPDDVFAIKLQSLLINGIGIQDVLSKKKIDLDVLIIKDPVVEIFHRKRANKQKDSLTLYERLSEHMKSISVNRIRVQHGTVINHNLSTNKTTRFENVALLFDNLLIDSTSKFNKNRFLFSKEVTISFHNYKTRTANNLYNVVFGSVFISTAKDEMTIRNMALSPLFSKKQFQNKVGHQKERYNFQIPKIQLQHIDWWSLANEESLVARLAKLHQVNMQIYLDRSLPQPPPKIGNFPQQLLLKLSMPVNVDVLRFYNMHVAYEEFNPNSGQSGTIDLTNINGKVTNITNIPENIRRNKWAKVTTTASFMNKAPLQANLRFNLSEEKKAGFSADLHLDGFDPGQMNKESEALGLVKIKSGSIKELKARVNGSSYEASGKVLLLYNNLHITALKKGGDDEDDLKKRRLFNFIANAFVIKNDNPSSGEMPRNPDCYFKRDPQGSYFNLLWKTILVGILKTAGANEKLAKRQNTSGK